MKLKKAAFFTMFFITLCGFVGVTWADDEEGADFFTGAKNSDFIKSRTYIGVGGISAVIDSSNDFNGNNTLQFGPVTFSGSSFTNPEIDLIPSINRNFGFGVLVGHREGPWAGEFTFWRSDHTATWTGGSNVVFTTPATYQSIDINFKRYLFTQLPTQPFLSLGLCFPWLWVSQGSNILDAHSSPPPYSVIGINDETISGLGFELGAGMEIYLDDHFSLVGGAYQRWTEFNQINGAEKLATNNMYFDGNPSDVGALAGNGLNFFVGTTVGFK